MKQGYTIQEYTKLVVRHLQCSRSKKIEIRRQLESDIEIALSEGRQLEEILCDMGDPEVVAGEFNENIGGNRKRKRKSRRRLWIILAVVLAILAIAGGYIYWILPKVRDIQKSSSFDVAEIQSLTEEVIRLFSAEDYEALEEYGFYFR